MPGRFTFRRTPGSSLAGHRSCEKSLVTQFDAVKWNGWRWRDCSLTVFAADTTGTTPTRRWLAHCARDWYWFGHVARLARGHWHCGGVVPGSRNPPG